MVSYTIHFAFYFISEAVYICLLEQFFFLSMANYAKPQLFKYLFYERVTIRDIVNAF